ncbi:MAG: universal stress protein, partial [Streptosporangiaceae bacterium]
SYAVAALSTDDVAMDVDDVVRTLDADQAPGVEVHVEVVDGLAARVLLDRCADADMLVLGTSSDVPGALRSAGPVIRACLRRAPCPVVVISTAQELPVGAGAPVPAGAWR